MNFYYDPLFGMVYWPSEEMNLNIDLDALDSFDINKWLDLLYSYGIMVVDSSVPKVRVSSPVINLHPVLL